MFVFVWAEERRDASHGAAEQTKHRERERQMRVYFKAENKRPASIRRLNNVKLAASTTCVVSFDSFSVSDRLYRDDGLDSILVFSALSSLRDPGGQGTYKIFSPRGRPLSKRILTVARAPLKKGERGRNSLAI